MHSVAPGSCFSGVAVAVWAPCHQVSAPPPPPPELQGCGDLRVPRGERCQPSDPEENFLGSFKKLGLMKATPANNSLNALKKPSGVLY